MPVVLLCHFDGTNGQTTFIDNSLLAHTLTASNTTVTTTAPQFGTGSGNFTASSSAYIDTGNAVDFNLGSGQFTVETWAYFTSSPSLVAMVSQWDSASNNGWWLGMNSNALTFFYSNTGSDTPGASNAFTPTLNTWYHVAVDRDASSMLRLYINGVIQGQATISATFFASTRNCRIGNDYIGTRGFPGHLDEMRITTGLAQYAGPFTPASAPFPNPGGATAQARAMVLA